jgi:hypothetical protein
MKDKPCYVPQPLKITGTLLNFALRYSNQSVPVIYEDWFLCSRYYVLTVNFSILPRKACGTTHHIQEIML